MFSKPYVATLEGLPTGFSYQRSSYGPYAKELKLAQSRLINNNLLQEERLGSMFAVKVGSAFEDAKKRYKSFLDKYTGVIEKTTDLFMRVDTIHAEALATVIFAAVELISRKKASVSETDVLKAVMEWKQRRRPPLDETMVASTIRNLGILGWLDLQPDDRLPVADDAEIYV